MGSHVYSFDDNIQITKMVIGDQISELSKRLNNITIDLHKQVRQKHRALLKQATHAGRCDNNLNVISEDLKRIRSSGQHLNAQVETLFNLIENQINVLGRLHDLSHLLRSASTVLTQTTRLKTSKKILKQAEIHYELSQIIEDKDIKQIELIQNERSYVISSRQKIRNLTQMQLVSGLKENNEIAVCNALKVFVNLHTLEKSLQNLMRTFISDLEQSLKECFSGTDISVFNRLETKNLSLKKSDSNFRGPGKTPQLSVQSFRTKFWKSLHWLLYEELYEICKQIRLLKNSLEHINQFNSVSTTHDIDKRFWNEVQSVLKKSFIESAPNVQIIMQEGLTKFLMIAHNLELRLDGEFLFESDMFAPLEKGFIRKCEANIKTSIADIEIPNKETVDIFLQTSAVELLDAFIAPNLAYKVSQVIIECGKEICTKIDAQIKLGTESRQVIDNPNTQQLQNTIFANTLFYYKDSVCKMLQNMKFSTKLQVVQDDIIKSLEEVDNLINAILKPLINSIKSNVNLIILSMHREPGLNTDKISTTIPSMYIKELQEFLSRSWINHIETFSDKKKIRSLGYNLARSCIELFIHNICHVRPISDTGRQRLKNDCVYMEQVIKPLCSNLSELGNSARLLRAMSFLIVQKPEDLVEHTICKDSLIPSYIVLFLLFGHAGPSLQSPHVTANWSNERLIEWLGSHFSEREKLDLISGALQRYRDGVRRNKNYQYDKLYPLIIAFFEKAVQIHK